MRAYTQPNKEKPFTHQVRAQGLITYILYRTASRGEIQHEVSKVAGQVIKSACDDLVSY